MTKRALHKRFNEHRANIRQEKKKKEERTSDIKQSLAEHFTEHSIKYVMIIEQEDDVETLRKRERYWINNSKPRLMDLIFANGYIILLLSFAFPLAKVQCYSASNLVIRSKYVTE